MSVKTFIKEFDGTSYVFEPDLTILSLEVIISIKNNSQMLPFRMKRDENGQWKFKAQRLPDEILSKELEFGDAIDDNLYFF